MGCQISGFLAGYWVGLFLFGGLFWLIGGFAHGHHDPYEIVGPWMPSDPIGSNTFW